MLFNSYAFLIFFPIVVLFYFVLPIKFRSVFLLIASYYFYMVWNPKYIILLIGVTIISYISGICLEKETNEKIRKRVLIISLILLIGNLFVFKYLNFFIDNINNILAMGGKDIENRFNIILPVGISFFTFQAISYVVDVYRNPNEKERNFILYALYIAFFPQLVAGPIERGEHLISQFKSVFKKKYSVTEMKTNFFHGSVTMAQGLFIKMVIADKAAVLVDYVFGNYYRYGTVELLLAAFLFALQIYCDFNGYTLIAIGVARIFGINLMENFNTPYFSESVTEFWRRWHISLSSWFKDYVYIPIGGNRCSKFKQARNQIVTMLLSGLWHGAGWGYITWGVIHGILMCVERMFGKKEKDMRISNRVLRMFSTSCLITFTWIFFRADSLKDAICYIERICTQWNVWALTDGTIYTLGLSRVKMGILTISLMIMLVISLIKYRSKQDFSVFLLTQPIWFRCAMMFLLCYMIICFGEYGSSVEKAQFIYFQF